MKSYKQKAIFALKDAEQEIRSLIASAAKDGSYDELHDLVSFAEHLTEMQSTVDSESPNKNSRQPRERDVSTTRKKHIVLIEKNTDSKTERKKKGTSQLVTSRGYPLFVRDGEFLVKVGISNSAESTYEHRASREIVTMVVGRVIELLKENGGQFTAEAMSDLRSHGDKQKIPGYQLYLCLGWLKRVGLVKQRGRKGYSVIESDSIMENVERHWLELRKLDEIVHVQ
ncbi:MAG: hypothetical protein H8E73_05465 [Planctomycetes bacterium]|nr:hypothetical protein [Planctomycetota bacterium]